MSGSTVVLVAAAGAAWEAPALRVLEAAPGVVVLKRCVDVDDLIAAAASGQAQAAVIGADAPGLDAGAVAQLRRHGVHPVLVVEDDRAETVRALAGRIAVTSLVTSQTLSTLPDALRSPDHAAPASPPSSLPASASPSVGGGMVWAVWGPAGAPGRTTLACALAAELGRRGRPTLLVDADPYGGAVAHQIGILDEVSGLLSAARVDAAGRLPELFATVQRAVDPRLSVVTGLPRAERWREVRGHTLEHLVSLGRERGDVVLDTGFCLEDDPALDAGRATRNELTLAALDCADEIVVVGAADPVGLARLARGLVELRGVADSTPVRAVVNRMRPSLGWSEREIATMVDGFARPLSLHFLPDDQVAADRALVAGRTLVESGESALGRGVAQLADVLRRRTAGTGRRQ